MMVVVMAVLPVVAACSGPADSPDGTASIQTTVALGGQGTSMHLPGEPATSPTSSESLGEPSDSGGASASRVVATTTPRARPDGYAVGTLWRDFVDTKRNRTLKTLVHYPARGHAGAVGVAPADGSFPIVLMAHGYRLPAAGYERMLTTLTASGYVTVSPAFPGTSAETGNANRSDITNQPADLSFVLDEVLALAASPGSELPSIASPDRVGVIGHSDGGLTASAIAYNSRFRDPRVAAVVVLTGGRALFPGRYFDAAGLPPLLVVHGTADNNPYAAGTSLWNEAKAARLPAYMLTIEGGTHIDPYMHETASLSVAEVVLGFLDAYLVGNPSGVEHMKANASDEALRLEG